MAILTVYTKLLNQTLSGVRIIDMGSTRTCQLYVIPREQLGLVSKEKPLHQYCFYLLIGQTPDGKPKAYIGQSNDFLHRVKDHQTKKIFWDTALVFVSKADEIYASEVFFLEYLGITKAMESGRYSLDENKQVPQKPSIAPDKENDMELFFGEIQFLASFYGCPIFERTSKEKVETIENYHDFKLIMKKKGIDATLRYYPVGKRYVLLSGSHLIATDSKSLPKGVAELRKNLRSSKSKSIRKDDSYILLQDIELPITSPSAAASFCTATAMQGTTAWIDNDNKTFISIFQEY